MAFALYLEGRDTKPTPGRNFLKAAVPCRPAAQPSMLASGRTPLRLTLQGHSPFGKGPLSSAAAAAHLRDNVDRLTLHCTSPETGANWRTSYGLSEANMEVRLHLHLAE